MILEFVVILPTQRQIPPADAARAFKIMGPLAWRYLPVCGALSVIAAIVLVAVSGSHDFPGEVIGLTVAGIACFVPAVATNLGFYLRAEKEARAWTPER